MQAYLTLNSHNSGVLTPPLRFRSGLRQQPISGSGALAAKDFTFIATHVPSDFQTVVIDLRQESHAVVNGIPVSWWVEGNKANAGLTIDSILQEEGQKIEGLLAKRGSHVTAFRVYKRHGQTSDLLPTTLHVDTVRSEASIAAESGFSYVRLPMQDRTGAPDAATVDALLMLIWHRTEHQWWHFHCQAGKGRTSIFSAMVDIIGRPSGCSLQTIAEEHHAHGSVDLLRKATAQPHRSKYEARIAFLQAFYNYKQSGAEHQRVPWSTWLAQNNVDTSHAAVGTHDPVRLPQP